MHSSNFWKPSPLEPGVQSIAFASFPCPKAKNDNQSQPTFHDMCRIASGVRPRQRLTCQQVNFGIQLHPRASCHFWILPPPAPIDHCAKQTASCMRGMFCGTCVREIERRDSLHHQAKRGEVKEQPRVSKRIRETERERQREWESEKDEESKRGSWHIPHDAHARPTETRRPALPNAMASYVLPSTRALYDPLTSCMRAPPSRTTPAT